jgi:putative SOS response-associated peptidase YedK
MAELHDCMPVILEQQDWPVWLGAAEGDHAALLR